MKKHFTLKTLLLTAVVGMLSFSAAKAQVPASSYGFTAESGTYTALAGGTPFTDVESDDVLPSTMIPLGFTFNFCGVDYTQIRAGSNGFMSFSASASNTAGNSSGSLNTIKPALFWLWDDLDGENVPPGTSEAHYETSGPVGSRVFTFEYKNWEWNWNSNVATVSVQVKLYEGTNVVEYVYEALTAAGNPSGSSGASIGIADGASTPTYLSLDNSTASPTASATTFTSNITTKPATGQIYRFTPPESCSTVAGLPTSGTIELSSTDICNGGSLGMTVATNVPMPATVGITYEWQTSPTGAAPWVTIGTTNDPSFSTPGVNGYYRCEILCQGTTSVLVTPSSAEVIVLNPQLTGTTEGERCGPGTVDLSATADAGSTINWYENATGGASLFEGANFSTPYITESTTYYTAASIGGSGISGELETLTGGTNGCGGGTMFNLTATATLNIDSILAKTTGSGSEVKVYYKLGGYEGSETTESDWTLHETITVSYTAGFVSVPLTTPLTLTGGQLYGIYINYNAAYTTGDGTNESNSNADLAFEAGAGLCSFFGGLNDPRVFNGTIYYSGGGCEGVRTAVEATINPSTVVTHTYDTVLCNDAVTAIAISSPTANYPSYNWSSDYLFTDAAGTTPYTSGTANTIYFRSTVSGLHDIYLMAGDPEVVTGCTYADTLSIWVQPGDIELSAMPDTICVTGSTTLSIAPEDNYLPGSIQWQESANGTTYNDIVGANDVSYTSPELSEAHYYKVIVTDGNNVCTELTKHILIANPELLSRADSFNCGPGTVVLKAQAGVNTGVIWYDNETGGVAVGNGSPFETPYLLETDTFWVSAGVGGGGIDPTWVGTGTSTTSGQPNLFYTTYEANKNQYLIKASELTAAGFTAGTIQKIGFDVLGVTTSLDLTNFAISMALTGLNDLTTTFESGLANVYTNASYVIQANTVNEFVLDEPFYWDGVSNLLIGTCFANSDWNGSQTIRYTSGLGFNASHYQHADGNLDQCANPTGFTNATSTSRPNILFDIVSGCESAREAVIAYIHPDPVVDLGDDVNDCVDSGTLFVLDAGLQPNSPVFVWDDGSSSQVRGVNESGTYSVHVTNQWGCASGDTINIVLRHNPVVELGNDTSVCNGVVVPLDAGSDGIEYFWNTGATTQVIEVNNSGQYNVFVTNEEGCVSLDTVEVIMDGELPSVQGIAIDNNGAFTFTFTAVNPQNVIGYEWDFGDGSPLSFADSATHTYAETGNYFVTVTLSSTCGFYTDSTSTHIVGINQINVDNDALTVYPNPANDYATVISRGGLKLEQVAVYNVLGQMIQTVKSDSSEQHKLSLSGLASGVYTLQVQTDKGIVTRKLEIIK